MSKDVSFTLTPSAFWMSSSGPDCPQGTTQLWRPSGDMSSGMKETLTCGSVNSGYEGSIEVDCFFGVLSINMGGCQAKSCPAGASFNPEVGGITASASTTAQIPSGLTGTLACGAVNSAYTGDIIVNCVQGSISTYSAANCLPKCLATASKACDGHVRCMEVSQHCMRSLVGRIRSEFGPATLKSAGCTKSRLHLCAPAIRLFLFVCFVLAQALRCSSQR